MSDQKISDYRKEYALIDNKIIDLLAKRSNISKKIGKFKSKNGLQIEQKKREGIVLNKHILKGEKKGLSKEFIVDIFDIILKYSKYIQKNNNK